MIGPLGRLGAAATLGQHCPQMTQRRCRKNYGCCSPLWQIFYLSWPFVPFPVRSLAQLCSSFAFEFVVRDFTLPGQLISNNKSQRICTAVLIRLSEAKKMEYSGGPISKYDVIGGLVWYGVQFHSPPKSSKNVGLWLVGPMKGNHKQIITTSLWQQSKAWILGSFLRQWIPLPH